MQWFEMEFLPYLENWERYVADREGFSDSQKKMMVLSRETLEGIRITGQAVL